MRCAKRTINGHKILLSEKVKSSKTVLKNVLDHQSQHSSFTQSLIIVSIRWNHTLLPSLSLSDILYLLFFYYIISFIFIKFYIIISSIIWIVVNALQENLWYTFLGQKVWPLQHTEALFFFNFNWDSPHARLNSHFKAWNYKKRSTKRITGYRKSV